MRQAAAYLGLSTWSVRALVAAGKVPTVDLGLRRILIDRVALDTRIA